MLTLTLLLLLIALIYMEVERSSKAKGQSTRQPVAATPGEAGSANSLDVAAIAVMQ